jgi:recombination protein RecR
MYTPRLARLIEELQKFPGVGPRSAQRMAFHLLKRDAAEVQSFSEALLDAKAFIQPCSQCFHMTADPVCEICTSPRRNRKLMAVVPEVQDVLALEATHQFDGLYHVLGGLISPMDGIGPDKLSVAALLERVSHVQSPEASAEFEEVILALPPSVEGDTTSLYLTQQLKPHGVKVSRIAFGLPVGGELEYADSLTLSRALAGRTVV